MVNDGIDGRRNVTHVRRVVIAQRRWHTNQNRIDFADLGEIGGRAKTLALGTSDLLGFDTMDVGFAGIQPVHLGRIDIESR